MLEETADELRCLKSHGLPPALSGIFVAECDLSSLCSKYPAVGNGGLVDISGEIGQGFIGGMDAGLTVDHPSGFPYRLREDRLGKFFARQGNKSGPEDIRQGAYRHEIILPGINPVSFVVGKPSCRYEAVNMGMVDQCPRPVSGIQKGTRFGHDGSLIK